MNYATLAARHFARAASLEAALRKIMAAHRFNVAAMSVTQVHSVCFDSLNDQPALCEVCHGEQEAVDENKVCGTCRIDYEAEYRASLEAVTAAGYEGISPSEAIRAQFENIADLEASAQALEDEVGPLLADIKSALEGHALDIDASGLLARIEKVIK